MLSKALAMMMVLLSLSQGTLMDFEDQMSLGGTLFLVNREYMITADYVPEDLVLPTVTLGIVMTSKFTRQVRGAVLEELHQDYVLGARARGFPESHILWKEVLPNALLPLITLLGLAFGSLLGGAAVVEIVFSWPGLGYTIVQAIIYRDFQTVQAAVLWISLMYMLINFVIDLSYRWLDPRIGKAVK